MSLPYTWGGVTKEGNTYTFTGNWTGAVTDVWDDWSEYDYVWVKYSGLTSTIRLGLVYDEWIKEESWGDVFYADEIYFSAPEGIVAIPIEKTKTFVNGNAKTDGKYKGEIYAKHVRQLVFQNPSDVSITIEGIWVGSEAEYMQDYESAFSYVVDYTALGSYSFWHADETKHQYTIGIDGGLLKVVNTSNKVYTEEEPPYSTEADKANWQVQYHVIPEISTFKDFNYLIKIKIRASVEGDVVWVFGNWGSPYNGTIHVTTDWKVFEIRTPTPHDKSFLLLQSGNLYGTIEIEKVELFINQRTIIVGSAGYTTFSTDKAVDVDGVVTAYAAKYDGSKIVLTPVTKIPAGAGVVIEAAADNYKVPCIESADALTDNDLKVSDGSVTADGTIYVLANKSGVVGFYKLKSGSKVPAGKAYLQTGGSSPEFIEISGDVTGIEAPEITKAVEDGVFYNLAGQRVVQPTKGLYIVNGKKVIIK